MPRNPADFWTDVQQRPWQTFIFGGPSSPITSSSIEYTMDNISGRAQVMFAGNRRLTPTGFPAVDIDQHCWIQGGYRNVDSAESNYLLFDGWIEDDDSRLAPAGFENTLSLGTRTRLTQYALGDPFYNESPFDTVAIYDSTPGPFNNGDWTDIAIVRDLFIRSGIGTSQSDPVLSGIGGLDLVLPVAQGITLTNRQNPSDLISQIDQATGCQTFDTPAGPQRFFTSYTPTDSAAWTLRQGIEILDVTNKRSLKRFYNRVVVKGIKIGGAQFVSIRAADPNLPPVAGGSLLQLPFGRPNTNPISRAFESELIQSQELADTMSLQLLTMGNRVERRTSVVTRFNPAAMPGQTVSITAPAVKIYSAAPGFVYGIQHTLDSGGAWTTWDIASYNTTSA